MSNMKLAGRTAIVTGAASGIGRAVAASLAKRGCHLALSDIDEVGLAETVRMVSSTGLCVSHHRLDVSDAVAIAAFPEVVRAAHASVDVLVNNAGVALGGTFEQVSERDFEWLFSINFWGVVRMTRAFLPILHKSDDARITNLSSLFGLIAPPGQTAYSASKFAVRGFSESLRRELANTSVGVTVVHPGGIATSIAKSARMPGGAVGEEVAREARRWDHLLKMPPERAGEIIVRGMERRQARVVVGNDAKIAAAIERIVPVSYWELLGPRSKS
jgi:NAD(P)-dependent dehydrogenase (short-subunit alcohol dehydrogenase family)